MKKNLYWMAAAFITLTAVGCTNAKKANVSAAGSDTTQVVDMHTAETSRLLWSLQRYGSGCRLSGHRTDPDIEERSHLYVSLLILTVKMPISMKPVRLR